MDNIRFVIIFFLKALSLYIVWFVLYDLWMLKVGWLDDLIIDNLVNCTEKILTIFGYTIFVYGHTIGIDGSHGVYIGTPCNGIELMALFAGFVIIFTGETKNKVWYIPVGILIIHFLNLLRVISLTLLAHYSLQVLDFNHKYTFTIILYLLVFFGWVIWVRYFSMNDKKKSDLSS